MGKYADDRTVAGHEEPSGGTSPLDGRPELESRFRAQLVDFVGEEVAVEVYRLIVGWVARGGALRFGASDRTTARLDVVRDGQRVQGPVLIYPNGQLELAFMDLERTPPFDTADAMEELVQQFARVPGVDLPDERPLRAPNVPLTTLLDHGVVDGLLAALSYYRDAVGR